MIACTKLFVIDEVRPVIFNGALNFIDSSVCVEGGSVRGSVDLQLIAICGLLAPNIRTDVAGLLNAPCDTVRHH